MKIYHLRSKSALFKVGENKVPLFSWLKANELRWSHFVNLKEKNPIEWSVSKYQNGYISVIWLQIFFIIQASWPTLCIAKQTVIEVLQNCYLQGFIYYATLSTSWTVALRWSTLLAPKPANSRTSYISLRGVGSVPRGWTGSTRWLKEGS